MKTYYFSDTDWNKHFDITTSEITDVLTSISSDTNTEGLILALYLVGKNSGSGGVAYVRNWLTQKQFISHRGRWSFAVKFPVPNDLPEKFKLIRLQFGVNYLKYPLRQQDSYGWELNYKSFEDHLAFLFAHELHHFRRYHLGFHPREGENSANRWAINHVRELNFQVSGEKINSRKKKSKFSKLFQTKIGFDPFKKFRNLKSGDKIVIKYDPRGRYQNESVTVVRSVRRNSRRIVIETGDGKSWRWPMEWVMIVT